MGSVEKNISEALKKLNEQILVFEKNMEGVFRIQERLERFSEYQKAVLTKNNDSKCIF